jgi:hypothetical protein
MALLRFLEKIDLECALLPEESKSIKKKALRLDGKGKKGLRCQLKIGDQCNCCDYLLPIQEKIVFIEVSDLITQLNVLRKKQQETPKDLKKFLKEPLKYINQEMKLKIFGSLIILFKLPTNFKVEHNKIHQKQLEVVFVLCSNNLDDAMIFDYLQVDVENTLKPLIKKVEIVNIPMFKVYLKKLG